MSILFHAEPQGRGVADGQRWAALNAASKFCVY
jgi:hypothetical protein